MNDSTTNNWPSSEDYYAGWIPCVTGQLSFSLVGQTDGFSAANLKLDEKIPHRMVAVHQHRVSNDLPWHRRLVELGLKWSTIDFFFVAQTEASSKSNLKGSRVIQNRDEIGALRGQVFAFVHFDDHKLNKAKKDHIERLRKVILLSGQQASSHATEDDFSRLGERVSALTNSAAAAGAPPFVFDVCIYRNGEVRIDCAKARKFHYFSENDTEEVDSAIKYFAKQVYFFCKDAAHRHYHHRNHADNILPLRRSSSDDDQTWRRETLWDLARTALELRRSRDPRDQMNAIGVLAYAEAFQRTLAKYVRSANDFNQCEFQPLNASYDFMHTRESLNATHDVNKWNDDKSRWGVGVLLTWTVATSTIYLTAVRIVGEKSDVPAWVLDSLRYLASHPETLFGYSYIVLFFLLEFFGLGVASTRSDTRHFANKLVYSFVAGLSRAQYQRFPIGADSRSANFGTIIMAAIGVGATWLSITMVNDNYAGAVIEWIVDLLNGLRSLLGAHSN